MIVGRMGRGARDSASQATGSRGTDARRVRLLRGLGASPAVPVTLDAIFESLAEARGWTDPGASIALRLVDALVQQDLHDFGRQAMRLRRALEVSGVGHDGARLIAGLQIERAVPVVAWVHGQSPVAVREQIARSVAQSKVDGSPLALARWLACRGPRVAPRPRRGRVRAGALPRRRSARSRAGRTRRTLRTG